MSQSSSGSRESSGRHENVSFFFLFDIKTTNTSTLIAVIEDV